MHRKIDLALEQLLLDLADKHAAPSQRSKRVVLITVTFRPDDADSNGHIGSHAPQRVDHHSRLNERELAAAAADSQRAGRVRTRCVCHAWALENQKRLLKRRSPGRA